MKNIYWLLLIIIIFFKIVFKINFSQKVLIKKKEIEKRIILLIRKKELYLIYFLHNNFYKEKTFIQSNIIIYIYEFIQLNRTLKYYKRYISKTPWKIAMFHDTKKKWSNKTLE